MLAETAIRRIVEVGRIRFVGGRREADPGEERPEDGTNPRGTPTPWTRRAQTTGRTSVGPIAAGIPIGIVFSSACGILSGTGKLPRRSRAEVLACRRRMGRVLAQPVEIGPVRFSNLALSAGWQGEASVRARLKTSSARVSAPGFAGKWQLFRTGEAREPFQRSPWGRYRRRWRCQRLRPERADLDPTSARLDRAGQRPKDGTVRNGAAACLRLRPEGADLNPASASLDRPGQRPMDGTWRNGAFLRLKRDKCASGCPSSVYLHWEVVRGW